MKRAELVTKSRRVNMCLTPLAALMMLYLQQKNKKGMSLYDQREVEIRQLRMGKASCAGSQWWRGDSSGAGAGSGSERLPDVTPRLCKPLSRVTRTV